MEEFHTKLSDTPHTWVEWSCSQLLQNTPLHPELRSYLQRLLEATGKTFTEHVND
jgi:hypothetical protein